MTQRGGFRGGVKPRLAESIKRTSLSCRVKPETKVWLANQRDESAHSIGEWVDMAVSAMSDKPGSGESDKI
jgi:hypothetical protein